MSVGRSEWESVVVVVIGMCVCIDVLVSGSVSGE